MGRAPCCSKVGLHRGSWTAREDLLLTEYIHSHGEGNWRSLPKKAGLLRCGKSCRLRWMNYLRPDIKRGNISREEEDLITRLHCLLGNRWSLIAGRLPGRTDNEIKNYWNSHLCKKLKSQGLLNKQQTFVLKNKRETSKKSAENAQTARIYAPKPTRFQPAMMSWGSAVGGGDDSSGFTGSASLAPSWQSRDDSSSDKEFDRADQEFDRAAAGFLDLGCDFGEKAGEETLEKLYLEYSQLLELEVDVKPIIH